MNMHFWTNNERKSQHEILKWSGGRRKTIFVKASITLQWYSKKQIWLCVYEALWSSYGLLLKEIPLTLKEEKKGNKCKKKIIEEEGDNIHTTEENKIQ